MNYRILGNGGLKVSAIGLGCMGMSHAYGAPADRKEMTELLSDAVDMGYTFFDTAESYGTTVNPHDNEELLGSALRPFRDRIVLATKFGISFESPDTPGPHAVITDSRPETIRRSVEGSLRRLRTDHIDLYYQHHTDPQVEPETVASATSAFPTTEMSGSSTICSRSTAGTSGTSCRYSSTIWTGNTPGR